MKKKARALVILQFTCIGYLLISGPLLADTVIGWLVEISGLILGVRSVQVMKWGHFNISPEVREGSRLIISGPYRWIRHPMYLSILLVMTPLLITKFSWLRLLVMVALMVVLTVKMNYEERLLGLHFDEYEQYRQQTSRLFPFIY